MLSDYFFDPDFCLVGIVLNALCNASRVEPSNDEVELRSGELELGPSRSELLVRPEPGQSSALTMVYIRNPRAAGVSNINEQNTEHLTAPVNL